jgi:F-type H+-transporting ATPase subunit c
MKAAESVGRNPGASGKILVQSLLSAALAEGAIIIVILMGK